MYEFIIYKFLYIIGALVLYHIILPYVIYSKISKMLMETVELRKQRDRTKKKNCDLCVERVGL